MDPQLRDHDSPSWVTQPSMRHSWFRQPSSRAEAREEAAMVGQGGFGTKTGAAARQVEDVEGAIDGVRVEVAVI